jgi:hypothetical protein
MEIFGGFIVQRSERENPVGKGTFEKKIRDRAPEKCLYRTWDGAENLQETEKGRKGNN